MASRKRPNGLSRFVVVGKDGFTTHGSALDLFLMVFELYFEPAFLYNKKSRATL